MLSFRERFVPPAFLVNMAAQAQSSQFFFIRLTSVGAIGPKSLFFIDSVEHYRQYDEDGNAVKGKYAMR